MKQINYERAEEKQYVQKQYSLCDLSEVIVNNGKNTAQASKNLQAVVNANQAIIAWIRGQIILLHDIIATC